jgi:hypothetical protein
MVTHVALQQQIDPGRRLTPLQNRTGVVRAKAATTWDWTRIERASIG